MSEQDPNQPEQSTSEQQQAGSEAPAETSQAAASESQAPAEVSEAAPSEATGQQSEAPAGQEPADSAMMAADPSAVPSAAAEAGPSEAGAEAAAPSAASEASTSEAPPESSKPKSETGSKVKSSTSRPGSTTGTKAGSTTGSSKPSSTTSRPGSNMGKSSSKAGGSTTGKASSTTGKSSTSRTHHSSTKTSTTTTTTSSHKAAGGASSHRKRIKLGELDLSTAKIGFLGAGKIAESTINGLIHYGKISASRIYVAAPSSKGLEKFKTLGCRVTKRNYDIFGRYDCDIVFLAFHGYVIKHCFKLGGQNRPHPLCTNYIPHQRHPVYILSLVSGVSLGQIKQVLLNPESPGRYVIELHRIMVNTAVGHGLGLCAIDCEPDSKKLSGPIRQLLSSIAHLEYVPATQMDAACAIGGSGLAFSYYFINALADGAFRMGLSRQQAIRFASKTAQCAAQTMLESGKHPAELRDNVSAPSGAAIYGIHVLEKNDVASGVTAAVEAAHKRAHDLATQDVTQS